jgi:hypothetical protein
MKPKDCVFETRLESNAFTDRFEWLILLHLKDIPKYQLFLGRFDAQPRLAYVKVVIDPSAKIGQYMLSA